MKVSALALVLTAVLGLSSCGQNGDTPTTPRTQPTTPEGQRDTSTLTVVSESGEPISGARVLIGQAQNQPFAGNFLTTDNQGQIKIPSQWNSPQPITIQAPGYTRLTYFEQLPQGQSFKLHSEATQIDRNIKGIATGLEAFMKENDGYLDFAIVSPQVDLEDLFLFRVSQIVSPEMDTTSILGKSVEMPANISLPSQKEKYSLLTFTAKKPTFRLKVQADQAVPIVATHGRARVKEMSDAKGDEILNAIEFQGAGYQLIPAGDNDLTQNIAASQIRFTSEATVTAPNLGSSDVMGSMALSVHPQSQKLYLSDAKVHDSGQSRKLKIAPNTPTYFVFIWGKRDSSQNKAASLIVNPPGKPPVSSNFLQLIARPQLKGRELSLAPPQAVDGVRATGMYLAMSNVEQTTTADVVAERVQKKWELFSNQWTNRLTLPAWPNERLRYTKLSRWEVVYLATSDATRTNEVDIHNFTGITHATRNFVDIKE